MTYRKDFTLPTELMEQVSKQGLDILPELIQVVINAAMQAERQQYLKAEPYQHSEEREGHANGYKPKTVHTRVGSITFSIPQVREGGFYPEALEKGLRSERALLLSLAEMYVQGVSTCKVRSGAIVHWENISIYSWTPITNRCGRTDRCAIWLFCRLLASIQPENVRFWAFQCP